MPKNSLLDDDFDDDDAAFGTEVFGDDDEGDSKLKGKEPEGGLEVEIKSDVPEEDQGKWNADKTPVSDDEPEDEAAKHSRRVRERIAKETAKVHAERRAKEDRERQLNEAINVTRRLIEENNQLKGLIENGEGVFMKEHKDRLESQIAASRSALREAHEAGDINGQIAAQEALAALVAQKDRASTYRSQPLQRLDEKQVIGQFAQSPVQQAPVASEDAVGWQAKNKWFGRDEVMTAHAMAFHNHLKNREGITEADGKVYWDKINKEMATRFPERLQSNDRPRRENTVVAPATRSAGGAPRRTVTLTESQVAVARRLGLSPQQYAEQVVAEQTSGSKEWTHGR